MAHPQLNRWQKGVEQLSARNWNDVEDELASAYTKALRQIKEQLKDFIADYEALSYSQRMEADRLLGIAIQIQAKLNDANQQADPAIKGYKARQLEAGYYGEWYVLEQAHRITVDLPILNDRFIEQLVYNKVDGQRLSKRLYKNTSLIAEEATQALIDGIVRGEGYDWAAARIEEATEASYYQALRIARTEGGQAQSAAKQRAYEESIKKGVKMKKRWLSTLDKKTRHSHQDLDGQLRDIDEDFTTSRGAKGPGPRLFGVAREDINCRCTTIQEVEGYPVQYRHDNEEKEAVPYQTYKQWSEAKGYTKPAERLEVIARKKSLRVTETVTLDADQTITYTQEQIETVTERVYRDLRDEDDRAITAIANADDYARKTGTQRQRRALSNYVGSGYTSINGYLRQGQQYFVEQFGDALDIAKMNQSIAGLEEHISELHALIQTTTLKEDIKVFRIVYDTRYMDLDPAAGKTRFPEKGFMSTTPYGSASSFFNTIGRGGTVLEIDVPAGTPALWLGHSGLGNERELLFSPGQILEWIEDIEPESGHKQKHFRLVPAEELERRNE